MMDDEIRIQECYMSRERKENTLKVRTINGHVIGNKCGSSSCAFTCDWWTYVSLCKQKHGPRLCLMIACGGDSLAHSLTLLIFSFLFTKIVMQDLSFIKFRDHLSTCSLF